MGYGYHTGDKDGREIKKLATSKFVHFGKPSGDILFCQVHPKLQQDRPPSNVGTFPTQQCRHIPHPRTNLRHSPA